MAEETKNENKMKTNYRIQLASNFQVVEFNLEINDDEVLTIDDERVLDAVNLVNKLGEVVVNTIKKKDEPQQQEKVKVQKVEEMASAGQIKFLKKFGIDGSKMTKQEAWQTLQKLTNTDKD